MNNNCGSSTILVDKAYNPRPPDNKWRMEAREIELTWQFINTNSEVLFIDKTGKAEGSTVIIDAEETMVILWR